MGNGIIGYCSGKIFKEEFLEAIENELKRGCSDIRKVRGKLISEWKKSSKNAII